MGTTPVGFRMDTDLVEQLDQIKKDMGLKDRSDIVIIACREFVDRRKNQGLIKEQIRQALREEPALVAEAVQIYAARQLQKKE
jgi:metal-responsive CopG/Arc/MetJ family transcriptional regulator